MRRAIILAAVLAAALASAQVARADDADWGWDWWAPEPAYEVWTPEPSYEAWTPEPSYEAWAPEPSYEAWMLEPSVEWPEPATESAGPTFEAEAPRDPPMSLVPEGLYLVNEVYVQDVVTVDGPHTVYTTETAAQTPGTYARELASVATGEWSAYDGAAFNGRAALTDGQSVAGTYYETFVLTEGGFASVGVVFFQNDDEFAERAAVSPLDVAYLPESSSPFTAADGAAARFDAAAPSSAGAAPVTAPSSVTWDEVSESVGAADRPAGPRQASTVAVRVGAGTGTFEVLRGRTVSIAPQASVGGVPAAVVGWRLTDGYVAAARVSGEGATPFEGRWDRLAPPGATWPLEFAVTVALPEGGAEEVRVRLDVLVIAPALAL